MVLDEEAGRLLDEQTGELAVNGPARYVDSSAEATLYGDGLGRRNPGDLRPGFGDSGGASRFFYCAKASTAERSAGLDEFEAKVRGSNFGMNGARPHTAVDYVYETKDARNTHPTVKPIDLMRWLVRLVTPPGGTVLDPFAGSGTTGCAAVLEGFRFIGLERDPEYVPLAEARIKWWASQPPGIDVEKALAGNSQRTKVADTGQGDLLAGLFDMDPA